MGVRVAPIRGAFGAKVTMAIAPVKVLHILYYIIRLLTKERDRGTATVSVRSQLIH